MTKFFGAVACFAVLFAAGCTHKELNSGRCNSSSDCPSGQTCDLSAAANGTCVCAGPGCDGGAGTAGTGGGGTGGGGGGTGGNVGNVGGSSGNAGTGGAGGCQPACTAPRAICGSSNTCVECVTSADCMTAAKPICDTGTGACVACSSDDQCVAKNGADPGVCMAHQDGRCATVDETLFVENKSGCSDTATGPGAGTSTQPFCSMQPVATFLSSMHDLVLVRGTVSGSSLAFTGQGASQTSIVGQQTAFIAASTVPAFAMTNGSIYIRGVKFSSSASIGVQAIGGTLRLEKVTVDSCTGGILLGGASFDIENTTVTNNRSTQDPDTTVIWAGIYVKVVPTGGTKLLRLSSIEFNQQTGVICAGAIDSDGVFSASNSGGIQVATSCGFMSCTSKGATCGAP